eukprot:gnl/TRDRNA2_/TRDRNA2_182685_c0_seq1.p1 gnl/TRDRNA2_/TRDRNA2_182685_c0~~gnl/TRDRNA2_/TRDRNA2_182685_c0_seq1.p1  ORF type:complete len:435 (+),score=104.32 gnl/TRDRNA2_/TRDRNA2_182685_c0_seq1:57-1361(+)
MFCPRPRTSCSQAKMRVGLIGGGTVGGGVCEILKAKKQFLSEQGVDLQIVKLCVRDASKKRDFEIPEGCEVLTDPMAVVNDDSIEMIVELMGGVTVAKDVVMGALAKGKQVVTGNKALIATFLREIQEALKSSPGGSFAYEAAVCGGIPIIHTMQHDYVGDEISSVMGIMNGTTNFILSKMESEGAAYADVLAEAQALGYAETPPDFDVEGWDARSKLAILCKLAFGCFVPEESIPCNGITRVTGDDFKYAAMMKSSVKILGVGQRNEDGSVSAHVSTCIVPFTDQLSRVGGALNSVAIKSKNLSTCSYSGPGAGRFPTANSVVNDMVMIAKGERGPAFPYNTDVTVKAEVYGRFYVRFVICDGLGIVKSLGEACEKCGISIHSLLQIPIVDHNKVPMVITTEKTSITAVKNMCAELQAKDWNLEQPLVMPILD